MPLARMLRLLSIAAFLAGCSTTVGDLDGFTEDRQFCPPGGNPNTTRDLDLQLIELGAHTTNLFEATVVNETTGVLSSRIIYDPLIEATQDIHVDNAMPSGTYTLDFYADLDGDRVYTSAPGDHSWHRPICDDGSLTFVHIAMFESLNRERQIGGDLTLTLNDIPLTANQGALEVRVIARFPAGLNQTVGVYRYTNVVEGRVVPLDSSVTIRIEGILDGGTEHTIYYFFDQNRDGQGDTAGGDLICMRDEVADPVNGLTLELDMTVQRTMGLCGLNVVPGADDPIPGI